MATSMTTHSPDWVEPVCKIRMELLDRLAGAVESLGRAKLNLAIGFDSEDYSNEHSVRTEVVRLRNECGSIRSELESHRASHHC